jgi:hypothetical protein
VLFVLVVFGSFAFYLRASSKPPLPIEVSIWYWHKPFSIPDTEMKQLRGMGVRRLFVRAGVFREREKGLRLTLPQEWKSSATGLNVHLVFNFGYDVVRGFGEIPNGAMASAISGAMDAENKRAEAAGVRVAGVQLDFDCPTSKLPKYASLLTDLRKSVKADGLALSITALPTWLTSSDLRSLAAQTDFIVPQFYEAEISRSRRPLSPISSLARFERGIMAAGRLGVPFYAGVPAYGRALVFDGSDKLLGVFRDMGPDDAMRVDDFKLERSYCIDAKGDEATSQSAIGEEIVEFAAAPPEGQKPYHIVFNLPTATLIEKHLKSLRERRPSNCLGAILFRYPERGERSTVPLATLESVAASREASPKIEVETNVSSAPWDLIDAPRSASRPPVELRVQATNRGSASTFFSPDSITLTLVLDQPGVDSLPSRLRSFDGVETYFAEDPKRVQEESGVRDLPRASSARANVLVFTKACLAPGESLATGPIELRSDGATTVRGFWSARCNGGFGVDKGAFATRTLSIDTAAQANRKGVGPDALR